MHLKNNVHFIKDILNKVRKIFTAKKVVGIYKKKIGKFT